MQVFLFLEFIFFSGAATSCSVKTAVLESFAKFTGKHLLRSLFLIKLQVLSIAAVLRETPTLVFPCEYCEIFRSTYFTEHLQTVVSVWVH